MLLTWQQPGNAILNFKFLFVKFLSSSPPRTHYAVTNSHARSSSNLQTHLLRHYYSVLIQTIQYYYPQHCCISYGFIIFVYLTNCYNSFAQGFEGSCLCFHGFSRSLNLSNTDTSQWKKKSFCNYWGIYKVRIKRLRCYFIIYFLRCN